MQIYDSYMTARVLAPPNPDKFWRAFRVSISISKIMSGRADAGVRAKEPSQRVLSLFPTRISAANPGRECSAAEREHDTQAAVIEMLRRP